MIYQFCYTPDVGSQTASWNNDSWCHSVWPPKMLSTVIRTRKFRIKSYLNINIMSHHHRNGQFRITDHG